MTDAFDFVECAEQLWRDGCSLAAECVLASTLCLPTADERQARIVALLALSHNANELAAIALEHALALRPDEPQSAYMLATLCGEAVVPVSKSAPMLLTLIEEAHKCAPIHSGIDQLALLDFADQLQSLSSSTSQKQVISFHLFYVLKEFPQLFYVDVDSTSVAAVGAPRAAGAGGARGAFLALCGRRRRTARAPRRERRVVRCAESARRSRRRSFAQFCRRLGPAAVLLQAAAAAQCGDCLAACAQRGDARRSRCLRSARLAGPRAAPLCVCSAHARLGQDQAQVENRSASH